MASKKKLYVGIGLVIVVLVAGGFLWRQKISRDATSLGTPPAFVPPVYVSNESPTLLTAPLYLLDVSEKETPLLTTEQEQSVAHFKKKILARLELSEPLSKAEKSVLAVSISTAKKPPIGGLAIADQSIFHFTSEELARISEALKQ